ncbi:glyoxalase-like domain-containing protein [Suillus discolor]|uniref:Glyoxalase-like domain-containing protein n=1 Tax=Suillus discolor TaxID=1912936 RepID=A0A9P7F6A1_9AGAM|nr:glyoxalase-like domain-containing protein [Suillus discolor]KAG2107964.1 glyoxalase-like domain-containing protein [Suillus discolor]
MSESTPSTKTLDHIMHLTPPGSVDEVSQQFRDLGFHVLPGGTHAGGLTQNALVVLQDGAYLELVSFTHPASHYPPGSPERQERDAIPWVWKEPGWIGYTFLGSSSTSESISKLINARAENDKSGIRYDPEFDSGRECSDGQVLKWQISAPSQDSDGRGVGVAPFFCGDVTPREWRVPLNPPSNAEHPSGVLGVAYVRILVGDDDLSDVTADITSVIGTSPVSHTSQRVTWVLDTPSTDVAGGKPRLIISVPETEGERWTLEERGEGIYEVAFLVSSGMKAGQSWTPYGKIVWLKE